MPQPTLVRLVRDGGVNGGGFGRDGKDGAAEPHAATSGVGGVLGLGRLGSGRGRGAGDRDIGVRAGRGCGRSAGVARRELGATESREASNR